MNMKLLTIVCLIFSATLLFGQDAEPAAPDVVPTNPEEFYDYMEGVMLLVKRKESEEIMDNIKDGQKANKFTPELYAGVSDLLTKLNGRGMKRFNFYRHVLQTMIIFSDDKGLADQHFNDWIRISKEVLEGQEEGKTSKFERYLSFSERFWKTGNLYDQSKGSHKWRSSSKVFDMKYENKILSMKYTNIDLLCTSGKDSLLIKEVNGTYYPMQRVFKGDNGKVEWTAKGATSAYAKIKNFVIYTKNMSYTAYDATLHYSAIFGKPIDGILKDRATKRSSVNLSYPKFESKERNIEMNDIGEGVRYVGGFEMKGSKVKGYGDKKGLSNIYIKNKEGKDVIKVASESFDILKGEKVLSNNAKITIYIHHDDGSIDSIYHPSTEFIYSIIDRYVDVVRSEARIAKVPFSNSMTQMDMNVPGIKWKIDTDEILLGDNTQNMDMASENHFDEALYEKYHNIISINPIIKFAVYSEKLQQAEDEAGGSSGGDSPDVGPSGMTDEEIEEFFGDEPEDEYEEPPLSREDSLELIELGIIPDPNSTKEVEDEPDEPEEELDLDLVKYSPKVIDANVLAILLDKRMEMMYMLTPEEVTKAANRPSFKIVENNNTYKQFIREYPKRYKFGAIDVTNMASIFPDPDIDVKTALPLYMEMVKDGFILYDQTNNVVTLREKLFHYSASVNTKNLDHDFDKIKIESIPTKNSQKKHKSNAVLDLKKGEIETFGVQKFILSDSQNVIVSPFKGKVQMKQGRDMDFDGMMSGGFCTFTGEDFHFKYDIFHVEMDSLNFLDMYIYKRARHLEDAGYMANRPKKDRYIDPMTEKPTNEREPINSVIEGGAGVLLIDVPSNKSGRSASDPMYPSFEATKKSRVYYDKRNRIGEGVYPRETFYYEIEPFILNGMDELEPEQLVFDGKLYAGNIFEPINEKLQVMYHDLSLGFETETRGNDPNPIYIRDNAEGKGRFKGVVGISNEGLLGSGRLNFLGARIESEYIEFLPEQFKAENVDSFNLAEDEINGIEYPKVVGEQVLIDWAPYSDSMHIESSIMEGAPFQFFDSTDYNLEGALTLTPKGLLGRGTFDWHGATLESNPGGDYVFGKRTIASESSSVIIKTTGDLGFAFENENVRTLVDFDKMTGDFAALEADLSTDLPYNSYQTTLDQFHWDMKTDHLYMDAQDGKTGFFLATEQAHDSLLFEGKKADYDLNTGLLKIDGVELIRVADAFIYPKDQHIEIEEAAHMRTLEDSKIICDTTNKNHVIQRATINVLSRSEYKADGFLEFNIEGKEQEIRFADVHVVQGEPGEFVTEGKGTVADTMDFNLDRRTKFKGEVTLLANSKDLNFEGYAKISSAVIPDPQWFTIDSKVDKKDVSIEYENPTNPEGQNMYVGLFLNLDSMFVYPTILAPKKSPTDRSIFTTTGVLKFNTSKDMYAFGDSARILGDEEAGKLLTVEEQTAKVSAEGRFDFNKGFERVGPTVDVDVVGDFSFFLNKESDFQFKTTMKFDFYLPQTLRDIIVTDLQSAEDLIDKVMYTSIKNKSLHRHMKNFIEDDKKFEKMWKKVKDDERLQLPVDLEHAFFFINNPLVWSNKTQTFVTKGRRLQLASIGGKHVGQVLKGHIEIMNDPSRGDVLTFYFISPQGDWYYFSYQAGFLKTISSNPDYTNAISALKKKDRRIKTENGQYIEVVIGSPSEYSSFKNKASAAFD
jgi:hypothetical protein